MGRVVVVFRVSVFVSCKLGLCGGLNTNRRVSKQRVGESEGGKERGVVLVGCVC